MLQNDLNSTLKFLYRGLLSMYGLQNWWVNKKSFEIMAGMILVQNTNWTNAEKALVTLKKEIGLSPKKLVHLATPKLIKLIWSAGLYNQKAKRIKSLSAWYLKQKFHDLRALPTELLQLRLSKIHGFGKETTDTILLYVFDRPVFIIDAYTIRLFNRLGFKELDLSDLQNKIQIILKNRILDYKEIHALIVEHNKILCRPKPICSKCSLKRICNYYKNCYLKSINIESK